MPLKKSHLVLMLALVITFILLGPAALLAQQPNLIKNGSFEEGFITGLGVANQWGYFHSGNVKAGFYDDTWELVVPDGEHAQLLELIDAGANDTYAGIYQKVPVEAGRQYELSFKGLIRSTEGSIKASNYGYRMQYAIDQTGNEDWRNVAAWAELPWDEQPRTDPANGNFTVNSLKTTFTAKGDSVTVFIRGWKKWADQGEGNYDIDAVKLVALDAAASTPVPTAAVAATAKSEPLPETGRENTSTINLPIVIASALLLTLLIGGALNRKRHQA